MREEMDTLKMDGRVVIGEGERDKAPMLYVGEQLGALRGQDGAVRGRHRRRSRSKGPTSAPPASPDSIAVLAAAERGGLLYAPDVYMEKIVVGPTARGSVHIDAPVAENLRNIADAFERKVSDLTIVVLDRPRHEQLIADIREAGARIRLITRRRPLGRHLGRRARHRRARGDGHRRRARRGDHRRGHALPGRRDPGAASRPPTRSSRSGSRPWASTT